MPRFDFLFHEIAFWPDPLALMAHAPKRYPALLESAAGGTAQGRYDLVMAEPGARLVLGGDGRLRGPGADAADGDFLTALDTWFAESASRAPDPRARPFAGGWLLYLGYELAGQIEPSLQLEPPRARPVAVATRIGAAIVRDRALGRAWIAVESSAHQALDEIIRDINQLETRSSAASPALPLADSVEEEAPECFLDGVVAIRRHIVEGDVFQVNLSREWRVELSETASDVELYRRLRASNPGSFAALLRDEHFTVVSSSPERLLEVRDGFAQTRPIAGTRPRGIGRARDRALSRELIAHPKERAEHIMLIDLERNDLGRFCRPGTIRVDELMMVESYAHVHHIVSNVRGQLQPGVTPGACIRSVFPGGTITGCPKVRCMEIIQALERTPRGGYTGSVGYLGIDGSLDLNILIRSLFREGREASIRAGAGIVADSEPERELEETRAKAQGVLRALD